MKGSRLEREIKNFRTLESPIAPTHAWKVTNIIAENASREKTRALIARSRNRYCARREEARNRETKGLVAREFSNTGVGMNERARGHETTARSRG